jgi:hypothetical protein
MNRAEAGDRGIAGHGADDDEQVGLLADRADLVGQPLERAGLDLALEPLVEPLAERARNESRAHVRECSERAGQGQVPSGGHPCPCCLGPCRYLVLFSTRLELPVLLPSARLPALA